VVFAAQGAGSREQARAEAKAKSNTEAPVETAMLAAVACGSAHAEQWGEPKRALDFFDIKGDLEALLALTGSAASWSFDMHTLPEWLHPGRGARVLRDGVAVGAVGVLHPLLQRQLDLPETCVFEIGLDALRPRDIVAAKRLPHFPSIRRDIAVEVDDAVEWAAVASAIRSELPAMLHELVLFDCFRGPSLGLGRKSLAIGLILQDSSRTLTDQDADRCVADAVARLESEFGASLRR
jgi:phenylalanyl-tRNA synthetase beta chain